MFKSLVSVKIRHGLVFFSGFWASWKAFLEVETLQHAVLEIMTNKLASGLYSRCTAVSHVPNVEGLFVAAHADGNVFVYDKVS